MKKYLQMIIALVFMLSFGMGNAVYGNGSVEVTDKNGEKEIYETTVSSILYQNQKMDISKTAGIVVDDEVMLTHYSVFKKMLGIKVTYEKQSERLFLETADHEMVLDVHSKTAIFDETEMELKVAPMKAKYQNTGANAILLPANTILECFGYTVQWDDQEKVYTITSPEGTELFYNGLLHYDTEEPITLYVNNKKVNTKLTGLLIDEYHMVPIWKLAKELGISYQYKNKKITLSYRENTVELEMNKKTATVNGTKQTMGIAPLYVKNKTAGVSGNMVSGKFIAQSLGIGYQWKSEESAIYFTNPKGMPKGYGIKIPLDKACQGKKYTVVDDYFNKQIRIEMNGNFKSFYDNSPCYNQSSDVKSIKVEQNSGETIIIITTNQIRGFSIYEESGILYVKTGAPKDIYDKIVVLDAGHGGSDPGALGNGLKEKDCTLAIVKSARQYFEADNKIKVYYTRATDSQLNITTGSSGITSSTSLSARTNFANNLEADMFISVHINSASSSTARGTEVYYSENNNAPSKSGLTSSKLANFMYDPLVKAIGSNKRGVKASNFYVIRYTKMPAILLECAFISNKEDANILKNEKKIDSIGKAIYDAVNQSFASYPTKR